MKVEKSFAMNQDQNFRFLAPSASVPRFLTSAPLMFQFNSQPGSVLHQTLGSLPLPSIQSMTVLPATVMTSESTNQTAFPRYNGYDHANVLFPSLSSNRVIGSSFRLPWNQGLSPVASPSILMSPMSAYSSPGDTQMQLPRQQITFQNTPGSRGPLQEVGLNSNSSGLGASKVPCAPNGSESYGTSRVDDLGMTFSSLQRDYCPSDQIKVRPVKPRGELVGLRVNEIEDHLRRQSFKRQSVVTPRHTISN